MNLVWLIVLAKSAQSTLPDGWIEYIQPFESLFTEDPFESLFTEDPFDSDIFGDLGPDRKDGETAPIVSPNSHEPPPGSRENFLDDYSESLVSKNNFPSIQPLPYGYCGPRIIPSITDATTMTSPLVVYPPIQHVLPQSPDSSSDSLLAKSVERAKWFFAINGHYEESQSNIKIKNQDPQLSTVFSQRFYQGVVKPEKYLFSISGKNGGMGYKISQDRILLLDGWGKSNFVNRKDNKGWNKHGLSKITLEIEEFRKLKYPLISDGLVVALSQGDELLMASYGIPPLAAILLRPEEGGRLKYIDRSSDDTIKSLNVQNHDIVAVGPLEKILQLESKILQLGASSSPEEIAKKIYGHASGKTLCIVATISINTAPQPKKTKAKPNSSPIVKRANNISSTHSKSKKDQPDLVSSNSSSESDDQKKRKLARTTREKAEPKSSRVRTRESPASSSRTAIEKPEEHARWFVKKRNHYNISQTNTRTAQRQSETIFSQCCYQGVVRPKKTSLRLSGGNTAMKYLVTRDRILLLDLYNATRSARNSLFSTWTTADLSKTSLKVEEFPKNYPRVFDGLVVALGANNQLLVASYGKPAVGAVLLRPEGKWLKFINRSSDDTVKALDLQDGDIVIVGPLGRISQLKSETFRLEAKSELAKIAEAMHDSVTDRSLCIVATISISKKS